VSSAKSREPAAGRRFNSPAQEAERLGVSETLILDLCRSGELPHRRLGRRVLLDPAEIDTFMARSGVSLDAALARANAMERG
jgi:excisionase family DNA binding protein